MERTPLLLIHILSNEMKPPVLSPVSARLGAQVRGVATDLCLGHRDNYPEVFLFVFPYVKRQPRAT